MNLAVYKTKHGSELVFESDDTDDDNLDYIRMTEIVDVEFTPLGHEEVVKKEIASIDNQIKVVQAAVEVKLGELTQRKNDLLALPVLD